MLVGSGHENAIYELSGPLATYDDFAAVLSHGLWKKVAVAHVDDAAYGENLTSAGLPGFLASIFVEYAREIRKGALAVESADFQRLLGRPATALPDALQQSQPGAKSGTIITVVQLASSGHENINASVENNR